MGMITVDVWDATGSRRQPVELPDDAPVNRILVVLVEKMGLPRQSPDGQLMAYKFHHKATGTQLLDSQTLRDAGVRGGDVLRLLPEITAGSAPRRRDGDDVATLPGGGRGAGNEEPMDLREDRFSRFRLIAWWDQERLRRARVLVVGCGALGNEIVKNLALLGIGSLFLVDLDRVEASNLSRSVLFREADEGQPKAEVAARGARALYPGVRVRPLVGNVIADVGVGLFRWADVVLGALDNREARLQVNRFCGRVRTPWIDGAIEALAGVARVFRPPAGPCYECTLGEEDWRMLERRRACSLLTRDEMAEGRVATTPTTASVIAGIQCQEALKLLHGRETLDGEGFRFEGVRHDSCRIRYQRNPACMSHDPLARIEVLPASVGDTTARDLLARARQALGPGAVLELPRETIRGLECPSCATEERVFRPLAALTAGAAACPACRAPRLPRLFHAIDGSEDFLDLPLEEIGVPPWDILSARLGERAAGFELALDRERVLSDLAGG